jgi:hypothetical protein
MPSLYLYHLEHIAGYYGYKKSCDIIISNYHILSNTSSINLLDSYYHYVALDK